MPTPSARGDVEQRARRIRIELLALRAENRALRRLLAVSINLHAIRDEHADIHRADGRRGRRKGKKG